MSKTDKHNRNQISAISPERKLDIVKTEWNYVQNIIKDEVDRKFKNRAWAVTSFSAILALALYHANAEIILLIMPISVFFWYIDASRQAYQNILFERDSQIQSLLRDPNDSELLNFEAPLFGSMLGDDAKYVYYKRKAIFDRVRRFFFGSMIIASLIIYGMLNYQWMLEILDAAVPE